MIVEFEFENSLFLFRREFRFEDNTALFKAQSSSKNVHLGFIFNKNQIDSSKNEYFGANSFNFMLESLEDLEEQALDKKALINFFYGDYFEVFEELLKKNSINCVFLNRDYTPFSINRDKKLKEICDNLGVEIRIFEDYLLNGVKKYLKADKNPYCVFTPFYKNGLLIPVRKLVSSSLKNFCLEKLEVDEKFLSKISDFKDKFLGSNQVYLKGGRKEALKIIDDVLKFKDYVETRDFPQLQSTTKLSAYLKFGCVSAREVYFKLLEKFDILNPLIRQLYWRDFNYSICYNFPYVFGGCYIKKYDKLVWENDLEKFEKWKRGETGFPIVDAGMRELNETGYMHNRVRMIVASFLTKDLHIDWKWGEKYFAQKLVDYDNCLNNGNWQWSASTGCDAQPYFRIFNPWLQQVRFDKDCKYIKKWVKELDGFDNKLIHNIFKKFPDEFKGVYNEPIVEHSIESKIAKEKFKEIV